MNYNIKAHPTIYSGVNFRSRLEATWAVFFDIIKWKWDYEPYDLDGWTPDFLLTIPCTHSECSGDHKILIEVKPYEKIIQFRGHKCLEFIYGFNDETGEKIPADSSAAFGINSSVTYWEMGHGAGGGIFEISDYFSNHADIWKMAKNWTQWKIKYNKPQFEISNCPICGDDCCTCP
jgi:hypothetical protein